MPLTHSDWQSILKAIGRSVTPSSIQHAVVSRVDVGKQKVWLEGLGPDPVPFAAWEYRVKTIDPHDDGRVEYQDIEVGLPQKGDTVLVAKSMGTRELARIIAPVQFDPVHPGKGSKKNFFNTQGEFWPGMMMDFTGLLDHTKSGPIDPFGDGKWLYCNGAAVKRSEYAHLFKRISTRYGVGDGSTTFNLPDYRGRMAQSRGTAFATVGATGGSSEATLGLANLPAHTHSTPNHQHDVTTAAHQHSITADGSHTHGTGSVDFPGFIVAHTSNPPPGSFGPAQGSSGRMAYPSGMASAGSHSHGGLTGSAGGGGNTDTSGGGTTGSAGSGTPVAVMPPYLVDGGKIIRVRR